MWVLTQVFAIQIWKQYLRVPTISLYECLGRLGSHRESHSKYNRTLKGLIPVYR